MDFEAQQVIIDGKELHDRESYIDALEEVMDEFDLDDVEEAVAELEKKWGVWNEPA